MIYLNGAIVPADLARIDPADRGFTLADGLFETLRAYRGKPFRWTIIWSACPSSAAELGIPMPLDPPAIAGARLRRSPPMNSTAVMRRCVSP